MSVRREVNIGTLLGSMADGQEDETVLIDYATDERRHVTRGTLDRRSSAVAAALDDQGIEPGERIGLVMGNSLGFYLAYFGAAKAGLTVCPFNPGLAGDELGDQISRSNPRLLIADDAYRSLAVEGENCATVDVPLVTNYLGAGSGEESDSFVGFYEGYPLDDPAVAVGDRAVFQILFTSGTSGRPKGVQLSHLNTFTGCLNYSLCMPNVGRDSVHLNYMPSFHNGGQFVTLGGMLKGGVVILGRDWDAVEAAGAIEEHGVTHIMGHTNAMITPLLDHAAEEGLGFDSLETVMYIMAPLSIADRKDLIDTYDVDLALASGQTECFGGTIWFYPEHQLDKAGNYWGVSSPLNEMGLVSDDGEEITEAGTVGEIACKGPTVMEGYLDDDHDEPFHEGWLLFGDLGVYDEDGLLKFYGRKKDMVKTGGENVSTAIVQDVLASHPAVGEAAVFGLPHPKWAEAVTAVVNPASEIEMAEVLEYCSERLATYEVPKEIVIRSDLPKTETGKIRVQRLKQEYEDLYTD